MHRVIRALLVVIVVTAVAMVVAVGASFFTLRGGGGRDAPAADTGRQTHAPAAERVMFLQHDGCDPAAPGAALILHPLATGGALLAITDPAILQAAAGRAHYTDDSAGELGLTLLSIIALSPPTSPTRVPFATLFMDGREIATLTCFIQHCIDPDSPRDLAGLPEAGRPAVSRSDLVSGADAIRAREAAILADPLRLLSAGAEQLPPASQAWPGFVTLDLPAVVAPIEAEPGLDPTPYEAELTNRLSAALAEAGLGGDVDRVTGNASWSGLLLWQGGVPATDADGYLITAGWLPVLSPDARIWLAEADAPRLAAALAGLPPLGPGELPGDPETAPWIAVAIAAHDLEGGTGDFALDADIPPLRTLMALSDYRLPEVALTYFEILP
jgi:hypothetical protein